MNREIFYTLREVQVPIDTPGAEYNHRRPDSVLNYRPPAPAAIQVAAGLTRDLALPPTNEVQR